MTICMPKEKLNQEPWKSDKFAVPPDVTLKKLIKWNHSKSYIDNPTWRHCWLPKKLQLRS